MRTAVAVAAAAVMIRNKLVIKRIIHVYRYINLLSRFTIYLVLMRVTCSSMN